MEIYGRLENRLNKVPGITLSDIGSWSAEAEKESGLTEEENENAVFYLALAIAYETIAGNAAHYFKFTDGEESVDKSNIFSNYIKLAKEARKQYRKQVRGRYGASQSHVARADEYHE
ncbi:hypothetical protein J1P26_20130 [Neobacillus sp. MM2021_6]|uniref:hypothetical protein n=1 Tax=Bacillaceae TaxID=186817 RepID=UPI0014097D2B|nr:MULTISPECIES: hypothetical protein [Bacillaceae]MBO0962017.1 hypothetical protein [Neobacillus sp. MM2021_6]NHC20288.1 hypothetical protein [Bacillus sp. MM2020_4]